MSLESLIEKYDKNLFFKTKTKFKHYQKKLRLPFKIGLISCLGFLTYEYHKYNESVLDSLEHAALSKHAVVFEYENFIKNNPDHENIHHLKMKMINEKNFSDMSWENYMIRKYFMGDHDINLEYIKYFFLASLGFLLIEDVLFKKRTKITKNITNYTLTFTSGYVLLNLLNYKPISLCSFEEMYHKGLFTYLYSLILVGFNYVNYSLFHNSFKKPLVLNYPKNYFNFIRYMVFKHENSSEKRFSFFSLKDTEYNQIKSFLNFEKNAKIEDLYNIRQNIQHFILNNEYDFNRNDSLIETKFLFLPIISLKYKFSKKNLKFEERIEKFKVLFSNYEYESAFNEMEDILKIEKYASDFSITNSLIFDDFIYQIQNNPEKFDLEAIIRFQKNVKNFDDYSKNNWDNTIKKILNDPKTKFSDIYSNRIKAIVSSQILMRSLAFKKGNYEDLLNEMNLSKFFYEVIRKEEKLSMAQPIKIVNLEDGFYYINSFCNGNDFMKIKDVKYFESCVDLLKIMHSKLKSEKDDRNYKQDVEDRILNFNSDISGIFKETSWDLIWNFISKSCNSVFDSDPHGEQTILSDEGVIYRIDLEDKGNLEWPFQMNKLVIQSGMMGENYDQLVYRYCDGNNLFENVKAYLLASIPSALSYISRTKHDNSKSEMREVYLKNAIRSIEELNLVDLKKYFLNL